MADISTSTLEEEIAKILKNADLAKTSTKKVIQELEKNLGVELRKRKDEIDKIVMDYIKNMDSDEEEDEPMKKETEESGSDSGVEEKTRKTRATAKGKKTGGGVTKAKKGGAKGKGTGFTRSYKLSPALAELMGADEMPRHAVVKRIWALVKEKQMYDPNNKQYAICDEAMYKVIGKQRFRIFGMMKYLKTHFL